MELQQQSSTFGFAETGYKALRILGLEKKEQLSKHDLVIFLYAVGLVSGLGLATCSTLLAASP
jgi:hypothetical protein